MFNNQGICFGCKDRITGLQVKATHGGELFHGPCKKAFIEGFRQGQIEAERQFYNVEGSHDRQENQE